MKAYKDSNGLVWFGNTIYPAGSLGITSEDNNVSIWKEPSGSILFSGDVTLLEDINGDGYSTVADFLAACKDFFVKASGSSGAAPIDVTYDELMILIDSASLVSGQKYKITDFLTEWDNPFIDPNNAPMHFKSESVEQLIVTASTSNTIQSQCISLSYPSDIVFYTPVNFEGSVKGRIFRRIDEINNIDAGTDWRTIVYRRFKIQIPNQVVIGVPYNIGDFVKNGNSIYMCQTTLAPWDGAMLNFARVPIYLDGYVCSSILGISIPCVDDNTYYIPADTSAYGDIQPIGIASHDVYIQQSTLTNSTISNAANFTANGIFMHNTINIITNCEVKTGFSNNYINEFYNCRTQSDFYQNILGAAQSSNFGNWNYLNMYASVSYSTFGDYSYTNVIDSINQSNIGSYMTYNLISMIDSSNIGHVFQSNIVLSNIISCFIANNFALNTVMSDTFSSNKIYSNFVSNIFYSGTTFVGNVVKGPFVENTIEISSHFDLNEIGTSDFTQNTIIQDCYVVRNIFSGYVYANTIRDASDNIINGSFTSNNIDGGFSYNSIHGDFINNYVAALAQNNVIYATIESCSIDVMEFKSNVILPGVILIGASILSYMYNSLLFSSNITTEIYSDENGVLYIRYNGSSTHVLDLA